MAFTGIPIAALDFYDDLELDNSRTFWQANKQRWERDVRDPLLALADFLAPEFGEAKLFRPYRDVRFSKDKSPYKTHQGLFVRTGPSAGYYVQVDAAGVMISAGWYAADSPTLQAIRHHIDADGSRLRRLLDRLETAGWTVGGDTLVTAPRGWSVDHPHIDLLRHKSLTVRRRFDNDPAMETPAFAAVVADHWRRTEPLLAWLSEAVDDPDA